MVCFNSQVGLFTDDKIGGHRGLETFSHIDRADYTTNKIMWK